MEERGSCRVGTAMVRQEPHRLTLPVNEFVAHGRTDDVYRGGLSQPV